MTPQPTDADIAYVRRAIQLAREAVARGDYPFAAVLVAADGEVLFEGSNVCAHSGDSTDHAEVHVLKTAWRLHGLERIRRATIYVNGEPCPMCAGMILQFDIARVVYAAPEPLLRQWLGGADSFASYPSAGIFAAAGDRIAVTGGLLIAESAVPFEDWKARGSP
jgi:tRNA(Arg) A34 adenosine deaminase TadA